MLAIASIRPHRACSCSTCIQLPDSYSQYVLYMLAVDSISMRLLSAQLLACYLFRLFNGLCTLYQFDEIPQSCCFGSGKVEGV